MYLWFCSFYFELSLICFTQLSSLKFLKQCFSCLDFYFASPGSSNIKGSLSPHFPSLNHKLSWYMETYFYFKKLWYNFSYFLPCILSALCMADGISETIFQESLSFLGMSTIWGFYNMVFQKLPFKSKILIAFFNCTQSIYMQMIYF